mmetsp:Transcript_59071/g.105009  ORF Transcript_59071/g.105009 Transcript_59071/m.105009 type:complete len:202 (-) Transcript_59071:431-1036(-)
MLFANLFRFFTMCLQHLLAAVTLPFCFGQDAGSFLDFHFQLPSDFRKLCHAILHGHLGSSCCTFCITFNFKLHSMDPANVTTELLCLLLNNSRPCKKFLWAGTAIYREDMPVPCQFRGDPLKVNQDLLPLLRTVSQLLTPLENDSFLLLKGLLEIVTHQLRRWPAGPHLKPLFHNTQGGVQQTAGSLYLCYLLLHLVDHLL